MPNLIVLSKLKTNLVKANIPTLVLPNRLEGNPRINDFERNLQAEIQDPLWTLGRQWQFGEFIGEDAGTACEARIWGEHRHPNAIELADGTNISYDINQPLEMVVEREHLVPTFFLRCQIGRQWLRLLSRNSLKTYTRIFRDQFPLAYSTNEEDKEGNYLGLALKGKIPDGHAILELIQADEYENWLNNQSTITNATHREKLLALSQKLLNWYNNLYEEPDLDTATVQKIQGWVPNHLEYSFSLNVAEGEEKKLTAPQYASGHLDWYSFDQTGKPIRQESEEGGVQTFIPMPLKFPGMPHARYWQMEDNQTDFGKVDASPTAMMNLLLAHYGLTYSNDWFVLPYELNINTLCDLRGIMVKDVFGLNHLVQPAIEDPETDWQEFALFHQTELDNNTKSRNLYYLPPAVGKIMESEPLEKVNFMRDEISNMVWAIEHIVPSEAGGGRRVKRNVPRIATNFQPVGEEAEIRYILGTNVPDNWIPFVPVHKKGSIRDIHLQRARLPQGGVPQSQLLKEIQPVFFIEEEEIPRAGTIVTRTFQRTRWLDGKTYLWVGRQKKTGRGEGWSGLMFDRILPIKA